MTYTTKQLARISGISRDQLTQWDRRGLLRPERLKMQRAYTRAQALGVIALAELRRGGVSQRRIKAASAVLPMGIEDGSFVVFDGWMLYAKETAEEALHLLEATPGARVMRVAKLIAKLPI